MAKIATAGPLHQPNTFQFSGGASNVATTTVKRKTPSELRGELLKRRNACAIETANKSQFPAAAASKDGDGVRMGNKKDMPRNPRYIDTRMDEFHPSRKRINSLGLLSKKEVVKENPPVEVSSRLKNSCAATHLAAETQPKDLCKEDSATLIPSSEDRITATKAYKVAKKANDGTFLSVTDLSSGGENLPDLSNLDMDKALKGLVSHGAPVASESQPESCEGAFNFRTQNSPLSFAVCGKKFPLDLTLKTTVRVISSASVNWFHRSVNSATFCNQSLCGSYAPASHGQDFSGQTSSVSRWSPGALSSWVFPQSTLPPVVISALTSAAVRGQVDFLKNREQAWEDSFRSLYYMLRTKKCDLFYVCTSQFVVMFTACDGPKKAKRTCNAYISRSTRGLRSLLKDHGVCFSMPLFHSKGDDLTAEDLAELDKPSLHQVDRFVAMSDVDNGSQSLLMFSGNQNVHGLYDFLLNYRYFLTSLTGVDVPILYSPVLFENAALSSPQVRCKEVRRADHLHLPSKDSNGDVELAQGSSPGLCNIVEIKDAYLPPWVVTSICSAMASDGNNFEASFVTEPSSIGLNGGLDVICRESDPQAGTGSDKTSQECCTFGIKQTIFSPHLRSSFLKGLKYGDDSYTVSLSRV